MSIEKVNITEKLSLFSDYYNPRIVGELNDQQVKLVKLQGEFIWHKHDREDEMFLVISGVLSMDLRDQTIEISPGEFIIIPKGIEHRPRAVREVHMMLFEPATVLNTGDREDAQFTKRKLQKI
jgi:mannose-6-phosphate isomerase-like protein (cupin superfamily)